MGLFNFKKKKNSTFEEPENAGCPYSHEIPEVTRFGDKLSYRFDDVLCSISGDTSLIKDGSVVYAGYGGKVSDCKHNAMASINNSKICAMIDDYLENDGTVTARALYVDDKLHINIGFYKDSEPSNNEEEDEED